MAVHLFYIGINKGETMSFLKKTWLARIGVGLNRFRMNNSTDVVLESNPVSVTQQGDQLSADNMNNLETRIGNAFDEMAGNLAPIEISPASTNHAVGTQIVYNGILYKVSSAISTGDNLVVGTNITKYPVSNAISDISDITEIPNLSQYVTDTAITKVWKFYAYRCGRIISVTIDVDIANTSLHEIVIPKSVLPPPVGNFIAMSSLEFDSDTVQSEYGLVFFHEGYTRIRLRVHTSNGRIIASATYLANIV